MRSEWKVTMNLYVRAAGKDQAVQHLIKALMKIDKERQDMMPALVDFEMEVAE